MITQDLPNLPESLRSDFHELLKPVLKRDPYKCDKLPCHALTGRLRSYRTMEVEYEGDINAYRLVYRIVEKPRPPHVKIVSFDKHDAAYEKAKLRHRNNA